MIKMYRTENTGKNIIMYHEVLNKIRAESEDEYTPETEIKEKKITKKKKVQKKRWGCPYKYIAILEKT